MAVIAAMVLPATTVVSPGVAPGSEPVSGAEDALRMALTYRYPAVERLEIRPFGKANSDANAVSIEIVKLGARSAVRVGKQLQWYAVSGFQTVLSASRPIRAGEALGGEAARLEEKDVIAAGCEALTQPDNLNGMRSRRALRPSDLICENAIEPRPAVARGETVTVRYVGDRVSLVTKGIAQADGNPGEVLSVRSLSSADSYRALVSGAGEVTVRE